MLLKEGYDKKALAYLKLQCRYFAQRWNVDYKDILSAAHEKLVIQMNNRAKIVDELHLKKLLKTVAHHSVIEMTRLKRFAGEKYIDPMTMDEPNASYSINVEQKQLLQALDRSIRKHFSEDRNVLLVYDHTVLAGHQSKETSDLFGININTVKTNVGRIRLFANKIKSTLQ